MNLLFFIETGHGNGRSMTDELIAINNTKKINLYCAACAVDQQIGIQESIKEEDIEILILEQLEKHRNLYNHIKIIRKFVANKEIDVIHVQSNWQLLLVSIATLFLIHKPKVLYTIHGYRNNKVYFKRNLARFLMYIALFLFSDRIIVTCSFLKNKFKLLNYKISMLPLGVDNIYHRDDVIKLDDSLRLIFPASFRVGKRQDMIIRAFHKYVEHAKDKDSTLYLPGKGDLQIQCVKLVEKLNLQNQIIFPGKVSPRELLTLYNKSNILICSSVSETFCQSLAEAFCLGKLIITTRVGVSEDIIKDGENGYFFRNENELYHLFEKIASNPSNISRMGNLNYRNKDMFDWHHIAENYVNVVVNILNE